MRWVDAAWNGDRGTGSTGGYAKLGAHLYDATGRRTRSYLSEAQKASDWLTRYLYSSYLGGSRGTTESLEGQDAIIGLALDAGGNAYVTGTTLSRDFPVTANAVQRSLAGGACDMFGSPCPDAFMTKITAGGPGVVPKVNVTATPTDLPIGGTFTASLTVAAAEAASSPRISSARSLVTPCRNSALSEPSQFPVCTRCP